MAQAFILLLGWR